MRLFSAAIVTCAALLCFDRECFANGFRHFAQARFQATGRSEGAADVRPGPLREAGIKPRLGEMLPLDATLCDEAGDPVQLEQLLGSKPAILVFAYYRCPMLCNLVLNGLCDALRELPFDIGKDLSVITISFDARETSSLASLKKATYAERYGRPGPNDAWHFLVGDGGTIDRLTEAAGFRVSYDARQDQYAHAAAIMVLTPQGRISRYLYGFEFSPRDLRLALLEASEGTISSPVDQVLLFCYGYDSATGTYRAKVMTMLRVGAVGTLAGLASFIGCMCWREHRRGRTNVKVE